MEQAAMRLCLETKSISFAAGLKQDISQILVLCVPEEARFFNILTLRTWAINHRLRLPEEVG
jgi:hypothetical protein